MKVSKCFTNIFNLPQTKWESFWKHSLCFHGGTLHEMVKLYHQQSEPCRAEAAGELEIQRNAGSVAFSQGCSRSAVLHIHQLIPTQHGFPVTHCCIPQILKVKPFLLLWWLYHELPSHISVSVPGLAALKLNTKQTSFNSIWWPHYTNEKRKVITAL